MTGRSFMTSREVCNYMDCSIAVLNRLDKDGILKPARRLPLNNRRLYRQEDVDDYIESIKNTKSVG